MYLRYVMSTVCYWSQGHWHCGLFFLPVKMVIFQSPVGLPEGNFIYIKSFLCLYFSTTWFDDRSIHLSIHCFFINMSLDLSFHLSIFLLVYICLSIYHYIPICMHIYLCIYPFVSPIYPILSYLSHPSYFPYLYQSHLSYLSCLSNLSYPNPVLSFPFQTHLILSHLLYPLCLSHLSIPSIYRSIYLSIYPSIHPYRSIYLSIYLPIHPSIHPSHLSICLLSIPIYQSHLLYFFYPSIHPSACLSTHPSIHLSIPSIYLFPIHSIYVSHLYFPSIFPIYLYDMKLDVHMFFVGVGFLVESVEICADINKPTHTFTIHVSAFFICQYIRPINFEHHWFRNWKGCDTSMLHKSVLGFISWCVGSSIWQ